MGLRKGHDILPEFQREIRAKPWNLVVPIACRAREMVCFETNTETINLLYT